MADEPFETKKVSVTYTEWGEYHYFASFCYSFGYRATQAMGETLDLRRIWFDGELVYDKARDLGKSTLAFYFKHGTSSQLPVPGAELAYREHILLWFSNVDLGTSGVLPSVSAEFWEDGALTVRAAVELLAVRAGYDLDDISVAASLDEVELLGYILDGQATFESVLTDLAFFYDFSYTESAGNIVVTYDYDSETGAMNVDLVIPEGGIAVLNERSRDQKINTVEVGSDQGLPRSITASYFDYNDDYQQGQQTAFRNNAAHASQSDVSLSIPIVAVASDIRARLFDALARTWHERNSHAIRLMPAHMRVEPGTTLQWSSYGNTYTGVVARVTLNADWSSSLAVLERSAEFAPTLVDTQEAATPIDAVRPFAVRAVLLDVPDWSATQTEDGLLNYRVALGSATTRDEWLGAQLDIAKSTDLGNFQNAVILGPAEQIGIGSFISAAGTNMVINPGTIENLRLDIAGPLIVGRPGAWEIIEYTGYDIVGANIRLTGVTRGLFGTDDFQDMRVAGDTVVFADDTITLKYSVDDYRSFVEYAYRAVAALQPLDEAEIKLFRPLGNSRRPYSPNNVEARRETNGDIRIKWTRDDRFDGEPDNVYSIDIYNADWSQLLRRINNITQFNVFYTIAHQTVDGLNLATTLNALVFQVNASHVGRGFPGGGALSMEDAGILQGAIGPVEGPYGNLRVWSDFEAIIGGVRGPYGDPDFGIDLIELAGTIGGVSGPYGNLRTSPFVGVIGTPEGPYGELAEIVTPVVRGRYSVWVSGTAISNKDVMDYGLGAAMELGLLLIVHDVRYGSPSHSMTGTRNLGDPRFLLLGVQDKRASNGLYEAVYAFVVDDMEDLPTINVASLSGGVNPLTFSMTQVVVLKNIDMADPIDAFSMNFSNSNTSSHVAPSVTTTVDNTAIVALVGTRMQTASYIYSAPAGMDDLGGVNSVNDSNPDEYAFNDNGKIMDAAFAVQAVAGATGTKPFTYSGSLPFVASTVAVKYAPPPDAEDGYHLLWRIVINGDNGGGGVQVSEIAWFNNDGEAQADGIVSASSITLGFPASNAYDGDLNTSWARSGFGGGGYPEWYKNEFPVPKKLTSVTWDNTNISPANGRSPSSLLIQYSDTGLDGDWTTVYTSPALTWGVAEKKVFQWGPQTVSLAGTIGGVEGVSGELEELPTSAYSYWRIYVTEINSGGTFLDVSEIQFRIAGVDQAVGGTATASSVAGSFVASNAFDDNLSTRWVSVGALPQWIRYQFPAPVEIDEVSIHISNNGANRSPRDFLIEGSNDGSAWTLIHTVTDEPGWTNSNKNFPFA